MDPTAALASIRQLVGWLTDESTDTNGAAECGEALAIYVSDLDSWLSRGGLLPTEWAR